jgi:hypothetical protein
MLNVNFQFVTLVIRFLSKFVSGRVGECDTQMFMIRVH